MAVGPVPLRSRRLRIVQEPNQDCARAIGALGIIPPDHNTGSNDCHDIRDVQLLPGLSRQGQGETVETGRSTASHQFPSGSLLRYIYIFRTRNETHDILMNIHSSGGREDFSTHERAQQYSPVSRTSVDRLGWLPPSAESVGRVGNNNHILYR